MNYFTDQLESEIIDCNLCKTTGYDDNDGVCENCNGRGIIPNKLYNLIIEKDRAYSETHNKTQETNTSINPFTGKPYGSIDIFKKDNE